MGTREAGRWKGKGESNGKDLAQVKSMLFVSNPRRLHKYLKCWLICLPFLFRQISLLVTIHNTFINHSIVALRMRTLPQYPPDRLPVDEDKIQPKLRKSWIRRKASALQSRYGTPQRKEQEQQERVLREQREYQERRKADVEDDTRMVVDGAWLLLC